jgi:hypothetical protein
MEQLNEQLACAALSLAHATCPCATGYSILVMVAGYGTPRKPASVMDPLMRSKSRRAGY